jgi:hypothetical protein
LAPESDPLDDIDINLDDLDDLDDIDPELAALGFTKRELEELNEALAGLEDELRSPEVQDQKRMG